MFDFPGVESTKICAYWNFRGDNFYENLKKKKNYIFLLHSKEMICGIISKLLVSLTPPETKDSNTMLYSETNDVKAGIPLW